MDDLLGFSLISFFQDLGGTVMILVVDNLRNRGALEGWSSTALTPNLQSKESNL